jgi:hypothetical protein
MAVEMPKIEARQLKACLVLFAVLDPLGCDTLDVEAASR